MTRKRLWMNRISGIVCLLLWIAFIIFLSGTTGKIAGMALGIMLLVAVIYNLYLPKEVSIHLIIPAYAQKEEKITGRLCISNTGVFPVLSGKVFLQVKKTISGEQEMFSMNIRAAGRKNGAAAFVIDSEYMGFLEITILRVEQLFWMYEKGDICKSGEGGNDSATNNGAAFSSTKQRSCLFFF